MLVLVFLHAAAIRDAAFFQGLPHTLINFETDGTGIPVTLAPGHSREMPASTYSALGLWFTPAVRWVNDSGSEFDAAQGIGGSLENGIPGVVESFALQFSPPILAFGFWAVHNLNSPQTASLAAYDPQGNLLESVTFDATFHQGTVGNASYGFIGIESTQPIISVSVLKRSTLFDNLHFVQDSRAVRLRISRAPGEAPVLTWDNPPGQPAFILEQSTNLWPGTWQAVTVSLPGRYVIPSGAGNRLYYRLRSP